MQIKEIWFSFVWYKNFRFDSISNILLKFDSITQMLHSHISTNFMIYTVPSKKIHVRVCVPQEIYWRHRTECSRLEKNVAGWSLNTCGLQYLSWDIYSAMTNASYYSNYQFVDFTKIREFKIRYCIYCIYIMIVIDSSNNKN